MEPIIVINGTLLTQAQSMTVGVALNDFMISLNHDGLGDDVHGKEICKLYQDRIVEIQSIIMKKGHATGGS